LLCYAQQLVWWGGAGNPRGWAFRDRAGFVPPLYALGIGLEEAPDMIAFVFAALFVSWLSGEQKRAKDSLRQARDELDARVQTRTAELEQTNEHLQAETAERKIAEDGLVRAQAGGIHPTFRTNLAFAMSLNLPDPVSENLIYRLRRHCFSRFAPESVTGPVFMRPPLPDRDGCGGTCSAV
jgi:hypothetical protein